MCLGIPGQIVEITDAPRQMAVAEVSGVRREVSLAPVAERPLTELLGEWVLIHVGFAMAVIDADEAAQTLIALHDLGEAQEALEAMAEGERAFADPASDGGDSA
ncbi:HypC/HybG/HupF family hydrogenase formation chaperone [Salipiger aestuarii]|uniref:Hydrogenase maturation factor HypC n=1 Tax=Salipiger aestuarii TaxID=568098 RepID=A0A327YKI5_9RHOB|nr:HypC/HybG/HupF family hydrogenase formation chaperone [Salipiger aestuarii]KAA8616246.1 hydrogenase formation protein HypC [Salipiger aestuarii]KAB2543193.1 hydrogenase formation protein HypC [Salipiger aestuarii]RAK21518.1 hydrogenase expression/formation protein HypC [Salipiger aestuarii]